MPQFIECDYCKQQNVIDANCCEFCGAPVIMTELKVKESHFLPEATPFFQVATSTSLPGYPMELPEDAMYCTTMDANPLTREEWFREIGKQTALDDIQADKEFKERNQSKGLLGWLGL